MEYVDWMLTLEIGECPMIKSFKNIKTYNYNFDAVINLNLYQTHKLFCDFYF